MSENLFGLTVAADKGLDDLQCQRLLSENRRHQGYLSFSDFGEVYSSLYDAVFLLRL